MPKTTFTGYVPSLKAKHKATITEGKAIESKGGSIRYTIQGLYDGRKTFPKTVTKADFEGLYGFDAKEAEAVIIGGYDKDGKFGVKGHEVGITEKDGFTPEEDTITVVHGGLIHDGLLNHADTVGSPSPASVEPPAPSEKPFPQEPSNASFSADEPEIEYYDHVQLQESDGKLIMSLNRTVTSHFFEGDAGDLLEDVRGNSNWEWLTADQLGALSEADVLARGSYSDDGEFEPAENVVYAYTDYQISDWFNSLKENGIVVFEGFPVEKGAFYQDAEVNENFSAECEHNQVTATTMCEECHETKHCWVCRTENLCGCEVKEAFGFGKDEEEEEKPKEQEFTVVLQEGDKLELTDIEEEDDVDATQEEEDSGLDEAKDEKEAESYKAVSAKVTRPVKEEPKEEKDEDGLLTPMNVALGLGAVALGVAVLGAESPWDEQNRLKPDYDWTQHEDHFNPEEGEICGYRCGNASIVGYGDTSYCKECYHKIWSAESFEAEGEISCPHCAYDLTDGSVELHESFVCPACDKEIVNYEVNSVPAYTMYGAEDSPEPAEQTEYHTSNVFYADGEDLTSSEFVPFDQITSEIQQEWDETTAPIAADYEPLDEPTNANFSAEKAHSYQDNCVDCGKFTKDSCDECGDYCCNYECVEGVFNNDGSYHGEASGNIVRMCKWCRDEWYAAETVGSPSPTFNEDITGQDGPSAEPTNADFSADSRMGKRLKEEFARNPPCGECGGPTIEEIESAVDGTYVYQCANSWRCGEWNSWPPHREESRSIGEDESLSAETTGLSKNAQYAIGLAALGVGIALWNGDWVSKMFDRFKR